MGAFEAQLIALLTSAVRGIYNLFWFILVTLVVYRLTILIVIDSGPGRIFFNMREWVIKKFGIDSWEAEGINCPFCVSVWFSALGAAVCFPWAGVLNYFLLWMGLSSMAMILHLKVWRR